jgi:hypothetical protein
MVCRAVAIWPGSAMEKALNSVPRFGLQLVAALVACVSLGSGCKSGEKTCLILVSLQGSAPPPAAASVVFDFSRDGAPLFTRTSKEPPVYDGTKFALSNIDARYVGSVQIGARVLDAGGTCVLASAAPVMGQLKAGEITEATAPLRMMPSTAACSGYVADGGARDGESATDGEVIDAGPDLADDVADPAAWHILLEGVSVDKPAAPRIAPLMPPNAFVAWQKRDTATNGVAVVQVPGSSFLPNPKLDTGIVSGPPALVRDNDTGRAYVAWAQQAQIVVERMDGAWTPVGDPLGASEDQTETACPTLLFDDSGRLITAWTQGMIRAIYLRRRNNSTWSADLQGPLYKQAGLEPGACPRLAVHGTTVVAAWVEARKVYVRHLESIGGWMDWADGISSGQPADKVTLGSLVLGADGMPTVSWAETTGTKTIPFVRRLQGNTWMPIDEEPLPKLDNVPAGATPMLALDSAADASPWLVWLDNSASRLTYQLWSLNGDKWQRRGPALPSLGTPAELSVAISANLPFVVFIDQLPAERRLKAYYWQ